MEMGHIEQVGSTLDPLDSLETPPEYRNWYPDQVNTITGMVYETCKAELNAPADDDYGDEEGVGQSLPDVDAAADNISDAFGYHANPFSLPCNPKNVHAALSSEVMSWWASEKPQRPAMSEAAMSAALTEEMKELDAQVVTEQMRAARESEPIDEDAGVQNDLSRQLEQVECEVADLQRELLEVKIDELEMRATLGKHQMSTEFECAKLTDSKLDDEGVTAPCVSVSAIMDSGNACSSSSLSPRPGLHDCGSSEHTDDDEMNGPEYWMAKSRLRKTQDEVEHWRGVLVSERVRWRHVETAVEQLETELAAKKELITSMVYHGVRGQDGGDKDGDLVVRDAVGALLPVECSLSPCKRIRKRRKSKPTRSLNAGP